MVEWCSCTSCEGWRRERRVRGHHVFGMVLFVVKVNLFFALVNDF